MGSGSAMRRALSAATVYFLLLFTLGFVLGTIRVTLIAPHFGAFAAIAVEVPIMLAAAYFLSRWTIQRWQVTQALTVRCAMMLWFLILLLLFETMLGRILFGLTMADQLTALATPPGIFGLSAQIIAAMLPVFAGRGKQV